MDKGNFRIVFERKRVFNCYHNYVFYSELEAVQQEVKDSELKIGQSKGDCNEAPILLV